VTVEVYSYRKQTALHGASVMAKSDRLQLGDNICGHYRSRFNHCDFFCQQSNRFSWKRQCGTNIQRKYINHKGDSSMNIQFTWLLHCLFMQLHYTHGVPKWGDTLYNMSLAQNIESSHSPLSCTSCNPDNYYCYWH